MPCVRSWQGSGGRGLHHGFGCRAGVYVSAGLRAWPGLGNSAANSTSQSPGQSTWVIDSDGLMVRCSATPSDQPLSPCQCLPETRAVGGKLIPGRLSAANRIFLLGMQGTGWPPLGAMNAHRLRPFRGPRLFPGVLGPVLCCPVVRFHSQWDRDSILPSRPCLHAVMPGSPGWAIERYRHPLKGACEI